MELSGRVAIVTGASRGVGAAAALLLGERGCKVVCAARATDAAPVPIPGTIDETVAASPTRAVKRSRYRPTSPKTPKSRT